MMEMEHYERNYIKNYIFNFTLIWMQKKRKKTKKHANKKTTKRNQNQIYSVDEEPFWQGLFFQRITVLRRKSGVLMGLKHWNDTSEVYLWSMFFS